MDKRVVLIVLDSCGVGALPDAEQYGDLGVNTLLHIAENVPSMKLANLEKLGLGKIIDLPNVSSQVSALGAYGKIASKSKGKDTTIGHWEISGVISENPLPTYPNGFPDEVIKAFEEKIGKEVLGNKPASGTAILDELGAEHVKTGKPIVYTSADSVFQIAAHEEIIPLEKLYEYCEIARKLLVGKHGVGRVIARPFVGTEGNFTRTSNRHDYSIEPASTTMLDIIKEADIPSVGIGKIKDIFAGKGLTDYVYTTCNDDGVTKTLDMMNKYTNGLIFTNLVDFDMKYGHRRDCQGYANALEEFDSRLPEIIDLMNHDDLLIITADHGCDPSHTGTDHTREYIPVLIFGETIKPDTDLQVGETFANIGATVLEALDCKPNNSGTSMLSKIKK